MSVRSDHSIRAASPAAWPLALGRGALRILRAYRHRREAMQLLQFDDRMLADIGLTRSDVSGALATPLLEDPTVALVRKRQERRRAWLRRAG